MEWHWWWWLPFFYAITVFQINGCNGYFPEEKKALLDYKEFLMFHSYSEKLVFPSWVSDPTSDCCTWENVTCDSTTGHVIHLSLDDSYYTSDQRFSLNLSLFQPLKELRSLNLSGNCFGGLFLTKDYRSITILKMLETLDLGWNFFDLTVMKTLRALTSLKNLILCGNGIEGNFPIAELSSLQNLETLDLSRNGLSNPSTTEDVNALSRLKKLRSLHLDWNFFDEKIFMCLHALPNLTFLFLQQNNFRGALNIQELSSLQNLETMDLSWNYLISPSTTEDVNALSRLKKLKTLHLSGNNFDEKILKYLYALPTLTFLFLYGNNITGALNIQELSVLQNLETLDLSYNKLKSLSKDKDLNSLFGLKKLRTLNLGSNKLDGEVNWEDLCNIKTLQKLDLSYNELNGTLHACLGNLTSLRTLDLQYNSLSGSIPSALIVGLTSLESLSLLGNNFEGKFIVSCLANHSRLKDLAIGKMKSDKFQVDTENPLNWIPSFQLKVLNLSDCQLNSPRRKMPSFLLYQRGLEYINLSRNNLVGLFPNWLLLNNSKLEEFMLNDNSFDGSFQLPTHLNQLMGQLEMFDVSNNKLSGRLPANWPRGLVFLKVSLNNFEGEIPEELCMLTLQYINLSHNRFIGSIPYCFSITRLKYINLQGNSLTGTIPAPFSGGDDLLIMNVRDNNLSGSIPEGIYGLTNLQFLLLGGNALEGELSKEICKLQGLIFLDLSRNKFIGSIPSCLNNISFVNYGYANDMDLLTDNDLYFKENVGLITKNSVLSYIGRILLDITGLDLSFNHLTGEIPTQLGELSTLHTLNLSHNKLNGTIPKSFCNLEKIESLDLSYNNLSGNIPVQLQDLNSLAIFNVSYNNLSGSVPNAKQFGTFDEWSYKGNPYLHWENSNRGIATSPSSTIPFSDREKDESAIEFAAFFWSFGASFVTIQLTLVVVLWINPHWRRAWFYFMETCLYKCFGQFLPNVFY